jgi:pantothenate kinase-related protein Tda10
MSKPTSSLEVMAAHAIQQRPELEGAIMEMNRALAAYRAAYSTLDSIPIKVLVCASQIGDAHMLLLASLADQQPPETEDV